MTLPHLENIPKTEVSGHEITAWDTLGLLFWNQNKQINNI